MNQPLSRLKTHLLAGACVIGFSVLGSVFNTPSAFAGPFDRGGDQPRTHNQSPAHAEKRVRRSGMEAPRVDKNTRRVITGGNRVRPRPQPQPRTRPQPHSRTKSTGGTYKRPKVWDVQDDAWDKDRDRRRRDWERKQPGYKPSYDGWQDRARGTERKARQRREWQRTQQRRREARRDARRYDRWQERRRREWRNRNRGWNDSYYRPTARYWDYNRYRNYYNPRGYRNHYRSSIGIDFIFGNNGYSRYRWASNPYSLYRPGYGWSYYDYRAQTTCERILVDAHHYDHTEIVSVKQCYNPYDGYYIIQGSERIVDCIY